MKALSVATVLWLSFALMGQPSADSASRTAPTAPFPEHEACPVLAPVLVPVLANAVDLTGVVQRYCVVCHNERLRNGNLTLKDFVVDAAQERAPTAEKMIRKLRAGMMPPPGQRRPPPDTLLALVETLETVVDREAARYQTPARGASSG